jgi:hypothetical protein
LYGDDVVIFYGAINAGHLQVRRVSVDWTTRREYLESIEAVVANGEQNGKSSSCGSIMWSRTMSLVKVWGYFSAPVRYSC